MTSLTLTLIEDKKPNDSNSFKQHNDLFTHVYTNVNVLVVCQTKDIRHSTTVHIVSNFALYTNNWDWIKSYIQWLTLNLGLPDSLKCQIERTYQC